MSFAKDQMKELGVTEENNFQDKVYHPETSVASDSPGGLYYQFFSEITPEILKHEFRGSSDIQVGDLMVNYFDLNGYPVKYKLKGRKNAKYFRSVRLQSPKDGLPSLSLAGNALAVDGVRALLPHKGHDKEPWQGETGRISVLIQTYCHALVTPSGLSTIRPQESVPPRQIESEIAVGLGWKH